MFHRICQTFSEIFQKRLNQNFVEVSSITLGKKHWKRWNLLIHFFMFKYGEQNSNKIVKKNFGASVKPFLKNVKRENCILFLEWLVFT